MRHFLALLIFFTLVAKVYSQKFGDHQVALILESTPQIDFNEEEYKRKLYEKYKNEKAKYRDPYIEEDAFAKERFFASYQVYNNWPEATQFVKKVFEQSIPKQFNTSDVKIYVVRDPDPNAFCMEDGDISVTTGLLALIDSEAELASVLCHEYGHYYLNHVFESYKNEVKNELTGVFPMIDLLLLKLQSNYSKEQERQADTFAVCFFKTNGYSMSEIVKTHESFLKLTNKQKDLIAYNKTLFYFTTHPSDEERIVKSKAALDKWKVNGKRFQTIDSVDFIKIKKRAVDETIQLLFEELLYPECIEMAFFEHLQAPNDEFYRFFITESLRRQMVLESSFGNQYFITGQYKGKHWRKEKVFLKPTFLTDNKRKRSDFSNSIFNNYANVYNVNESDVAGFSARSLIKHDSVEFISNREAFDYFLHTQNNKACICKAVRIFNKKLTDLCSEENGTGQLEKDYLKNAKAFKNYGDNFGTFTKTPIVELRLRFYDNFQNEIQNKTMQHEINNTFLAIADTFNNKCFETTSKLNFRNKNKMWNILATNKAFYEMGKVYSASMIMFLPENCDFLNLFPEFSSQFSEANYKNILLLDIKVFNGALGTGWSGGLYCIDLIEKKIKKKMLTPEGKILMLTGKPEYAIPKILNDCAKLANIPVNEKALTYWEKKNKNSGEAKKLSYWEMKEMGTLKKGKKDKTETFWEREEKKRDGY